jgi:chromosome segregation ATPase
MKVFLIRVPVAYSDKISSHRTYIINPKKVRYIDYNSHFKKMDISMNNGDKLSLTDQQDVESIYENLVISIEKWAK